MPGNEANYNVNLEDRLLKRLNEATTSIDLATYEINLPRIIDALMNKAAQGWTSGSSLMRRTAQTLIMQNAMKQCDCTWKNSSGARTGQSVQPMMPISCPIHRCLSSKTQRNAQTTIFRQTSQTSPAQRHGRKHGNNRLYVC